MEADEVVVWGLGGHGDTWVWKVEIMRQEMLVVEA